MVCYTAAHRYRGAVGSDGLEDAARSGQERRGAASVAPRQVAPAAALALAVFGLALLVRWWNLPAQNGSIYGDEAQLMIEARRFATGIYTNPFQPEQLGLPALYDFLLSLPLRLAGSTNVVAARAMSGLLGALCAPLLLITAAELGLKRRVGVVAAVVLATTFWDVQFSRLALQNIMATPAATVAILCLAAAIRRGSLLPAIGAGAGLAWAFNAYLSGSMVAVVAALWLALLLIGAATWWRGPRIPADRTGPWALPRPTSGRADLSAEEAPLPINRLIAVAAVFALATLIFLSPLLPWLLDPNSALRQHMLRRYILTPYNRDLLVGRHPDLGGTASILLFQLKATLGMFTVRGDNDAIFNLPGRALLDPLSGALFGLGLFVAVDRWRRPSSMLLLIWLIVPVVLGVALTSGSTEYEDAPSFTRALPALPAICLLIAGCDLDL